MLRGGVEVPLLTALLEPSALLFPSLAMPGNNENTKIYTSL